jgi:hypothetical protein
LLCRAQIVSFKTADLLDRCLESLLRAQRASSHQWETCVVDNGSGEDLSFLLDRYGDDVDVVHYPENLGFGSAHNRMADSGPQPDVYVLVNPDCVVPEGTDLDRLLERVSRPEVAVVGPRLVHPDGGQQVWDHAELRGLRARWALAAGDSFTRHQGGGRDVAWVSGAFFLIKGDVFRAMTGFDERFFLYKEEEDLCLRVRRRGYRVRYEPATTIVHVEGVSGARPEHLRRSIEVFKEIHHRPGSVRFRMASLSFKVATRIPGLIRSPG